MISSHGRKWFRKLCAIDFHFQQLLFCIGASAVAAGTACAQHPVAGKEDGQAVCGAGIRGGTPCAVSACHCGKGTVGGSAAVGYGLQQIPYRRLPRSAEKAQGNIELPPLAAEILVELGGGAVEQRVAAESGAASQQFFQLPQRLLAL